MSSQLPAPRRIVTAHSASGEPQVLDDTIQVFALPMGLEFGLAYVQKGFPADPEIGVAGTTRQPEGMPPQDGAIVGFIDIPPGKASGEHFTNSLEYIVVTHGQITLTLHDKTTKTVSPGELVVQIGNVHDWSNQTDQPARVLAISLPAKPVLVNGETLDKALGAKMGNM